MKSLFVIPEKCSGCRICELVCSYEHFGVFNPKKSAIRILSLFPEPAINYPVVCKQCAVPKCAEACPVHAIYRKDGIVHIDYEKCIGCGACAQACPFGAIFMHPDIKHPIKCDLCGGDPKCVEKCPTGAITFRAKSSGHQEKHLKFAQLARRG